MQQILLVQETDLTPAVILVQINFCACWEPLQILVQAWNIWLILCKTYVMISASRMFPASLWIVIARNGNIKAPFLQQFLRWCLPGHRDRYTCFPFWPSNGARPVPTGNWRDTVSRTGRSRVAHIHKYILLLNLLLMLSQVNLKARDTLHLTTFSCLRRKCLIQAINPVFLQVSGERGEFLLLLLPPEGGCPCWDLA